MYVLFYDKSTEFVKKLDVALKSKFFLLIKDLSFKKVPTNADTFYSFF